MVSMVFVIKMEFKSGESVLILLTEFSNVDINIYEVYTSYLMPSTLRTLLVACQSGKNLLKERKKEIEREIGRER